VAKGELPIGFIQVFALPEKVILEFTLGNGVESIELSIETAMKLEKLIHNRIAYANSINPDETSLEELIRRANKKV